MELTHLYHHWPFRPLVDRLARHRFFKSNQWRSMQYGVYRTFAEARAFCNRYGVRAHYDLDHDWWRKQQSSIHIHDYPVLVHMLKALAPESRVADLGGSVGVSYFALRPELPKFAQWRVCELPDVVDKGRKLAAERHAADLQFTEHIEELDGHDVWLTAGAIQFIEQPFHEILAALKSPPTHVLINRLPVTHTQEDFITLQNTGRSISPCRVVNEQSFHAAMRSAGYAKRDSWFCPQHSLHVPLHPQHSVRGFMGYYFVRSEDPMKYLPKDSTLRTMQFGLERYGIPR